MQEPTPGPSPPSPEPRVLVRGSGDLDGQPGDEPFELRDDGALVSGALRGAVDLDGAAAIDEHSRAAIRVVEVDRGTSLRAVLVTLPRDEEEDPPDRYQVFVARSGALVRILDITPGTYGPIELAFPGDGTIRYVEDGWAACRRAGSPRHPVVRDEISFRLDGDAMREAARRPTRARQRCSELAACPYVYVVGASGETRVGEILRDLRGASAYAEQALELPDHAGGALRVLLREEKEEVTYLDSIHIVVGGVPIRPRDCDGPFCDADGREHLLRRGGTLDLTFDAPAGRPVLVARGYYVPTR